MAMTSATVTEEHSDVEAEFLHWWEKGDPPDLVKFLVEHQIRDAAQTPTSSNWKHASGRFAMLSTLEDYFAEFPILAGDEEASFDVIFQEFVLGEESDPELADRLARRFPPFRGPSPSSNLHLSTPHIWPDDGRSA